MVRSWMLGGVGGNSFFLLLFRGLILLFHYCINILISKASDVGPLQISLFIGRRFSVVATPDISLSSSPEHILTCRSVPHLHILFVVNESKRDKYFTALLQVQPESAHFSTRFWSILVLVKIVNSKN